MQWLRRLRSLEKFAPVHASVSDHFKQERSLSSRSNFKANHAAALTEWRVMGDGAGPRGYENAELLAFGRPGQSSTTSTGVQSNWPQMPLVCKACTNAPDRIGAFCFFSGAKM